jgi:hypothetical protein
VRGSGNAFVTTSLGERNFLRGGAASGGKVQFVSGKSMVIFNEINRKIPGRRLAGEHAARLFEPGINSQNLQNPERNDAICGKRVS